MPAPATAHELLDLGQKSGILEPSTLEPYLEKMRSGEKSHSPKELAEEMVRDGLLTRFQADQLLAGKWRNFIISGKFKLLERLGVGGMGAVFLCEHIHLRCRRALKVLPSGQAKNPAAVERFYREGRAVAALDHPNIVKVHDIDSDNGLHFLVMEYVEGASLHDIVKKRGPLDPLRCAHYVFQAALGLQHAFERGLVHRDIKPGNLLLDRTGTIKILDMGLARFFTDQGDNLTREQEANVVLGTADYLSPEQAINSHDVDTRADVYSLGCTLYYMLTGQPPFASGTLHQKLIWHQMRAPDPIFSRRPDVPPQMAAILDKMLAKSVDARYQTPAELAHS